MTTVNDKETTDGRSTYRQNYYYLQTESPALCTRSYLHYITRNRNAFIVQGNGHIFLQAAVRQAYLSL
jgi:hypothetical protein